MANEMRDRLVELFKQKSCVYTPCDKECSGCGNIEIYDSDIESIADCLLDDGWIRPPCKVGETLYTVGIYTGQIVELPIYAITVYSDDTIFIMENTSYVSVKEHIGKTVFLTKEQAEQKLKEMRGEEE